MATNETELLARLGLSTRDVAALAAVADSKTTPGFSRRQVMVAIARLRDEAAESKYLSVEKEEADAILDAKLADMGALLAMVLR